MSVCRSVLLGGFLPYAHFYFLFFIFVGCTKGVLAQCPIRKRIGKNSNKSGRLRSRGRAMSSVFPCSGRLCL